MAARIADGYFRLLKVLIAICLVLMVLLVFGNVVLRYVFNTGLTLSEELSRWLFVYLVFLGAALAERDHAHLGMDGVLKRLPPKGRRACLVASQLLMLWASWLLLKGSWAQTVINLGTTAPSSGLPVAIVYASGVVFALTVIPVMAWDLFRAVTGRLSDDELIMVRESEEMEEFEQLHPELVKPSSAALAQGKAA